MLDHPAADLVNVSQTLQVTGVPDANLLHVQLTRADGTVVPCTVANGGITFEQATQTAPAQLHFAGGCRRLADDRAVSVDLLCAN